MRKFFVMLIVIMLLTAVPMGCDSSQNNNPQTPTGHTVCVGETFTFSPFGDGQSLEIVEGSEFFTVIGDDEVLATGGGEALIRARKNLQTDSVRVTAVVADWQIMCVPVSVGVGESGIFMPYTSPADKAELLTYEILEGNCIETHDNVFVAVRQGNAKVLCRDMGSKKACFIDVTVENREVGMTVSQTELALGSTVALAFDFSDGKERDVTLSLASDTDIITIDGVTVTAKAEGTAAVVAEADGEKRYYVLRVVDWSVNFVGAELNYGDAAELIAGSRPLGADTEFEYTLISGDSVTIEGNRATATGYGLSVIEAKDLRSGKSARAEFFVRGVPGTVEASDLTLTVGEKGNIKTVVYGFGDDVEIQYELISGKDVIRLDGNEAEALIAGTAVVRCTVAGTEACCDAVVTVKKISYTLTVENMSVKVGKSARIEPVLLPQTKNVAYKYTVIVGADYVTVENGNVYGVSPGQAVLRCEAIGLSAFADFSVSVSPNLIDVPEGYIRLTDNIYASVCGGRFKTEQKVDFFTPLAEHSLYYTTDSSPVAADLKNARRWSSVYTVRERQGQLSEYRLMQQVDGALTWAGTSKNYSGDYVNNIQYGQKYPLINLAYVFNVALVDDDGRIEEKTTQSYVVLSSSAFDDVPIISLSMAEEYWFDGIPNGRGTSVYNNVYLPGGNAQAENKARAHLEFFDTTGSFAINTQVKVGGGWSRGRPQRTLHLNFNKDENGNKQDEVHFEIFGDRSCAGYADKTLNDFTRFRLWNGGSTYDSYMRFNDPFIQQLAQGLNVATAAMRPAIVYLNGEFWGMYYIREHYSDDYFKENYKVKKSNVQYFDYTGGVYNVSEGNPDEANAFIAEMTAFLNNPQKNFAVQEVYDEFFSKYVDEDSLIDLMIVQAWAGNWDFVGNRNNHRAWRVTVPEEGNPYTDGKLRFCLHDIDMGMQAGTLDGQYYNMFSYGCTQNFRTYNILNRALANEGFRNKLYDRAVELSKTNLSYEHASAVLTEMAKSVRQLIPYNITRWGQNSTVAAWENQITAGYNWLSKRMGIFLPAIKASLAIDDEGVSLPSGGNIIFSEGEFRTDQFWAGNGSLEGSGRKSIRGLDAQNYEISYTMVNNGIRDAAAQFHLKIIYGSDGNSNYVTRTLRNNIESVLFTDVKGMQQSTVYIGAKLYEGVHKYRYVKSGGTLSVFIDGVRAYDVAVPDKAITGIDVYQHNANAIYRNFVVRRI